MHGLAVVAECLLGETFGVAALLCAFRPSVSVGMQRHPCDAQPFAALLKLCRPIAATDGMQIGEQRANYRQPAEN